MTPYMSDLSSVLYSQKPSAVDGAISEKLAKRRRDLVPE
jgi:hypothetical protein